MQIYAIIIFYKPFEHMLFSYAIEGFLGWGVWADGWAEEWVEEWVRVRGVCRFSSLVKQNKKGKNCAVFCFAGKRKLLFYIL
jgi:hypothetical protein